MPFPCAYVWIQILLTLSSQKFFNTGCRRFFITAITYHYDVQSFFQLQAHHSNEAFRIDLLIFDLNVDLTVILAGFLDQKRDWMIFLIHILLNNHWSSNHIYLLLLTVPLTSLPSHSVF